MKLRGSRDSINPVDTQMALGGMSFRSVTCSSCSSVLQEPRGRHQAVPRRVCRIAADLPFLTLLFVSLARQTFHYGCTQERALLRDCLRTQVFETSCKGGRLSSSQRHLVSTTFLGNVGNMPPSPGSCEKRFLLVSTSDKSQELGMLTAVLSVQLRRCDSTPC